MKPAREYPARIPVYVLDADDSIVFASRLWINLTPGDIRYRVNEISKQFGGGAGWKNLPQELVNEILGYLLDNLDALKACSLTCKHLFGATRPVIHERLVCLVPTPDPSTPKGSLFSRRQRVPGVFERLVDADRSGLLGYTKHLVIKAGDGYSNQKDVREHLPHLRSIIKLHVLTLDNFHLPPLIPTFNEHFGMLTDTVRHLDIRSACGTELQLLYIICQFPLLEDLTIMSPAGAVKKQRFHVPMITQSPPLRGTLVLVRTRAPELYEGLAAFPGGLNFRSLELFKCGEPLAVFAACGRTVTSISYLWLWGDVDSEPNPFPDPYCNITIVDYSDPPGPQAMCSPRKIRGPPQLVQPLADSLLDPPNARNDNFEPAQRIRIVDSKRGAPVEPAVVVERRWLEGFGRFVG